MSYTSLIDSSLSLAFNQLKDLAKDMLLVRKTDKSFDFSTIAMSKGKTANHDIKAVILDTKKGANRNTKRRQILFKSRNIDDITVYDSVIYNDETWKFNPLIVDSGFTYLAEILKEG